MSFERAFLLIVLTAFIAVGYVRRRGTRDAPSATQAATPLHWFSIAAGICMTFVGGAAMLTTASIGYAYGWWSLVDPIAVFIGIGIALLALGRIRSKNAPTIASALQGSSQALGRIIGAITFLVYLLLTAAQLTALRKLISPAFGGAGGEVLLLLAALGATGYLLRGGLRAVTRTDILQLLTMLALFVVPSVIGLATLRSGAPVGPPSATQPMPIDLLLLFALPALWIPVSQDVHVRVAAARDHRHAAMGLVAGAGVYALLVGTAIAIGLSESARGVEVTDPETIVPQFLLAHGSFLGAFAAAAILAAIFSSFDSFAWSASLAFSRDIVPSRLAERNKIIKTLCNGAVPLSVGLAYALGLFVPGVLKLILTGLLLYVAVLFPIAIARVLRVPDTAILRASVVFLFAFSLLEVLGVAIPLKPVLLPAAHLVLIFVFTHLFPSSSVEQSP